MLFFTIERVTTYTSILWIYVHCHEGEADEENIPTVEMT